jgi:hypothetical protein
MNQKAEEKAAAPTGDGRTDKEKLSDIGLSDEELAALSEKDDETAADKGEAGKDADKPKGKEGEDAKGESEAEKEAAAAAEAAKTGEETKAETVPDHFTPMAETLSQEDLTAIDTELAELKTKFDDGDIDYEEYTDERLKLEKVIWHHEAAEITNVNAVEQRWQWERDWYMQSNSELNQSQVIYGAFASQVNALLADDEFATAAGFDLLTEAHKRVAAEIDSLVGPGSGGTAPTGRPAAGDKQTADERAASALAAAKAAESGKRPPETLAKVPAAEANKDVSKWAVIDALEGEDLQNAIDKMGPADLKEYEDNH